MRSPSISSGGASAGKARAGAHRRPVCAAKSTAFTSSPPAAGSRETLLAAAAAIVDDVALYIAAGNQVVFAEIGATVARFTETFRGDRSYDAAKLAHFVDTLRSGGPDPDRLEVTQSRLEHRAEGGQEMLRQAVTHYYEAMFEPDPRRKAQRILLANVCGGVHEQTRLQSYIQRALDAPLDDVFFDRSRDALAEQVEPARRPGLDVLLAHARESIARGIRGAWESIATVAMMSMKLPDGTLYLGRDLPAPPGEPLFPADLDPLDDGPLCELLRRYDALADSDRPPRSAGLWAISSAPRGSSTSACPSAAPGPSTRTTPRTTGPCSISA